MSCSSQTQPVPNSPLDLGVHRAPAFQGVPRRKQKSGVRSGQHLQTTGGTGVRKGPSKASGPQTVSYWVLCEKGREPPCREHGQPEGRIMFPGCGPYDCVSWVPCHRQREVRSQNGREGLARAGPQEMFIWTLLLSLAFLDQAYGLKEKKKE